MKRAALIIATTATLCGCAGQPGPAAPGAQAAADVPPNYRALAAAAMRRSLKDPDSVKAAQISAPAPGFVGLMNGGQAMVVCVRANAKNSFGGYTGLNDTALVFRQGRVAGMVGGIPVACQGRQYGPFPELLPKKTG